MARYHSSAPQTASSSRSPKVFNEGRVCGYPNCTTRLSRYNGASLCALHMARELPTRTIR
jgi:hypothetical protein